MPRPHRILHCASEPLALFGRADELALLDSALAGGDASVVALVGPGGQGKTAIVQHWLTRLPVVPDGLFFWSFYRGKDVDLCLREMLAYAEGLSHPPEASATWCVDRLVPILRRERWAVVLDGAEVVQVEGGTWQGRFSHPELGRLLEELASEPTPGVVALTTRFSLPTLTTRPRLKFVALDRLDVASSRALLRTLGVTGHDTALDRVAAAAGRHAKAVELAGTFLMRFRGGSAEAALPETMVPHDDEEAAVAAVVGLFQGELPHVEQDMIALATGFRDPAAEDVVVAYLRSAPVNRLLRETWLRTYSVFDGMDERAVRGMLDGLVKLRLLERVGESPKVIDAHPLVRRGFDHRLGPDGLRESGLARAGFLRGRPDKRRVEDLGEARESVELFHAQCDAGLWTEADSSYLALENPKHRLLAPALEAELLLRFFPDGDFRRPPLWPGFGRRRSLAIALEMLGRYEDALAVYPAADAGLRGDALIALGRLEEIANTPRVPAPWQELWDAYRCHALALLGREAEALRLVRSLVPNDVYEWVHVVECRLRTGTMKEVDARSLPVARGTTWADLAARRMRADHARVMGSEQDLMTVYRSLIDAYDVAGMATERVLTRLSVVKYCDEGPMHELMRAEAEALAERHGLGALVEGRG